MKPSAVNVRQEVSQRRVASAKSRPRTAPNSKAAKKASVAAVESALWRQDPDPADQIRSLWYDNSLTSDFVLASLYASQDAPHVPESPSRPISSRAQPRVPTPKTSSSPTAADNALALLCHDLDHRRVKSRSPSPQPTVHGEDSTHIAPGATLEHDSSVILMPEQKQVLGAPPRPVSPEDATKAATTAQRFFFDLWLSEQHAPHSHTQSPDGLGLELLCQVDRAVHAAQYTFLANDADSVALSVTRNKPDETEGGDNESEEEDDNLAISRTQKSVASQKLPGSVSRAWVDYSGAVWEAVSAVIQRLAHDLGERLPVLPAIHKHLDTVLHVPTDAETEPLGHAIQKVPVVHRLWERESELQQLRDVHGALSLDFQFLVTQLQTLRASLGAAEDETRSLRTQRDRLTMDLAAQKSQNQNLGEQLQRLTQQLVDANKVNDLERRKLAQTSSDLHAQKTQVSAYLSTLQRQESELQESTARIDELERESTHLQAENLELKRRVRRLDSQTQLHRSRRLSEHKEVSDAVRGAKRRVWDLCVEHELLHPDDHPDPESASPEPAESPVATADSAATLETQPADTPSAPASPQRTDPADPPQTYPETQTSPEAQKSPEAQTNPEAEAEDAEAHEVEDDLEHLDLGGAVWQSTTSVQAGVQLMSAQLSSLAARLREETQSHGLSRQTLSAERDALQETLHSERAAAAQHLHDMQQRYDTDTQNLGSQLQTLGSELSQTQTQLSDAESQIADLSAQNQGLRRRRDELESESARRDETSRMSAEEVRQWTKRYRSTARDFADMRVSRDESEARGLRLRDELLDAQVAQLVAARLAEEVRREEVAALRLRVSQEVRRLQTHAALLAEQRDMQGAESEALRAALSAETQNLGTTRRRCEEAETQNAGLRELALHLETQRDQLLADLSQTQTQLLDSQTQLLDAQTQLEALNTQTLDTQTQTGQSVTGSSAQTPRPIQTPRLTQTGGGLVPRASLLQLPTQGLGGSGSTARASLLLPRPSSASSAAQGVGSLSAFLGAREPVSTSSAAVQTEEVGDLFAYMAAKYTPVTSSAAQSPAAFHYLAHRVRQLHTDAQTLGEGFRRETQTLRAALVDMQRFLAEEVRDALPALIETHVGRATQRHVLSLLQRETRRRMRLPVSQTAPDDQSLGVSSSEDVVQPNPAPDTQIETQTGTSNPVVPDTQMPMLDTQVPRPAQIQIPSPSLKPSLTQTPLSLGGAGSLGAASPLQLARDTVQLLQRSEVPLLTALYKDVSRSLDESREQRGVRPSRLLRFEDDAEEAEEARDADDDPCDSNSSMHEDSSSHTPSPNSKTRRVQSSDSAADSQTLGVSVSMSASFSRDGASPQSLQSSSSRFEGLSSQKLERRSALRSFTKARHYHRGTQTTDGLGALQQMHAAQDAESGSSAAAMSFALRRAERLFPGRTQKHAALQPFQLSQPFVGFIRRHEKQLARENALLTVALRECRDMVERLLRCCDEGVLRGGAGAASNTSSSVVSNNSSSSGGRRRASSANSKNNSSNNSGSGGVSAGGEEVAEAVRGVLRDHEWIFSPKLFVQRMTSSQRGSKKRHAIVDHSASGSNKAKRRSATIYEDEEDEDEEAPEEAQWSNALSVDADVEVEAAEHSLDSPPRAAGAGDVLDVYAQLRVFRAYSAQLRRERFLLQLEDQHLQQVGSNLMSDSASTGGDNANDGTVDREDNPRRAVVRALEDLLTDIHGRIESGGGWAAVLCTSSRRLDLHLNLEAFPVCDQVDILNAQKLHLLGMYRSEQDKVKRLTKLLRAANSNNNGSSANNINSNNNNNNNNNNSNSNDSLSNARREVQTQSLGVNTEYGAVQVLSREVYSSITQTLGDCIDLCQRIDPDNPRLAQNQSQNQLESPDSQILDSRSLLVSQSLGSLGSLRPQSAAVPRALIHQPREEAVARDYLHVTRPSLPPLLYSQTQNLGVVTQTSQPRPRVWTAGRRRDLVRPVSGVSRSPGVSGSLDGSGSALVDRSTLLLHPAPLSDPAPPAQTQTQTQTAGTDPESGTSLAHDPWQLKFQLQTLRRLSNHLQSQMLGAKGQNTDSGAVPKYPVMPREPTLRPDSPGTQSLGLDPPAFTDSVYSRNTDTDSVPRPKTPDVSEAVPDTQSQKHRLSPPPDTQMQTQSVTIPQMAPESAEQLLQRWATLIPQITQTQERDAAHLALHLLGTSLSLQQRGEEVRRRLRSVQQTQAQSQVVQQLLAPHLHLLAPPPRPLATAQQTHSLVTQPTFTQTLGADPTLTQIERAQNFYAQSLGKHGPPMKTRRDTTLSREEDEDEALDEHDDVDAEGEAGRVVPRLLSHDSVRSINNNPAAGSTRNSVVSVAGAGAGAGAGTGTGTGTGTGGQRGSLSHLLAHTTLLPPAILTQESTASLGAGGLSRQESLRSASTSLRGTPVAASPFLRAGVLDGTSLQLAGGQTRSKSMRALGRSVVAAQRFRRSSILMNEAVLSPVVAGDEGEQADDGGTTSVHTTERGTTTRDQGTNTDSDDDAPRSGAPMRPSSAVTRTHSHPHPHPHVLLHSNSAGGGRRSPVIPEEEDEKVVEDDAEGGIDEALM